MAEGDAGKAEAGSCSAAAASGAGGCDAVKKRPEQSVAFHELFGFADPLDWLLMAAGSAGAVVHGAAMPVFFLLFGELVNGFGKNQHNLRRMTDEVSKYSLYFVYLGLVVCASSYLEIACWMYTGERQVGALRRRYLEAVLRQDVGFFDTDARTGDVVFSVSTDTLLVQDAIGEKVGNFIHYLATFLAGLVVGFVSAWRLALLSIAVIPGIAFAGGLYAYTLTGLTSKSRDSYANAGIIAEQAIAQVRTVYSYVGETKALNSYSEAIQNTLKLGYKAGMAKGLGIGCTYGIACMSWALVFWYAGVFIRNGQTDGGKAFTAIFSAIVGGLSLGQSFSNLGAFSKGKIAGYKLLEVIRQRPTIVQVVETGTHDELLAKGSSGAYAALIRFQETARNRACPSTRKSRSSRLSNSLSTRSLSLRSGSLRNLSYSYSTGADGRIEMVSNADNDRKYPAPRGYFFKLLKLNAPEWPYTILGAVGSVLSGFIGPTFAIVMSNMIEVFYYRNPSKMESKTREYVFIYIGTGLYAVVAYLVQHYFFSIMGENLTTRVRRMMLAVILRNDVGWFDQEENNSNLVAARLSTDAADVKSAIAERISVILQNMTSLLVSFVVGFIIEWRVALLILVTFPLLVLANFAQQLSMKGFAGDTAKAHAKTSMIAGEGVSNIRTVAAFNAQDKILSLFCSELRVPQMHSLRRSQISGALFGLSQLSLYASEALILWFGAHLVRTHVSTFSKVIKVFVVLVITANSVAETVSLAPEIVRGGESIRSVFSVLNSRTRIDPDDPDAEQVESVRGEIDFRHVDFAYPTRPDVMVFKDLSLRIRAGQSQALVGASGSGKSTVIALVERFYDPLAGKVMIDGKDIRRLNLKSLRLRIGLVQQEPVLFATSILENIAYGRDGATEEEVVEAAKVANVHGFVSALPDGYRTPVGERGVQLSGGQKQRIAIARAVLKDPAVLLLDEATSALDAESECVLQEALERIMKGRTAVLVAHRLSTIRGVDSIAVVQDGRVVEQGSHGDLVSRPDGAYSRLLQLQLHHG
ncbi:ABC transporter B family member 19 [Zea mays]|uniref:ABC transporter B family member 19 n=1 Tax=Zea mays TaxID=4577 RepID=A0A1D6J7Y9_MAIZE|nr:ABC transporter B family member 19 [Zea mays]